MYLRDSMSRSYGILDSLISRASIPVAFPSLGAVTLLGRCPGACCCVAVL